MSVTEYLLTCIKNHVLSDVAKLGGGINLDISTQKNKQIWCCLAIVMAGCEIHKQEGTRQQERAGRLQAAYYRQVAAILEWPDLPPYVTESNWTPWPGALSRFSRPKLLCGCSSFLLEA